MTSEDAAAPTFHATGLHVGDIEVDGDDAEGHQSDIDIGQKHQHQREERTREERQDFDEEVVHRVAQAHDTPIDARLELTCLVALCRKESQTEGEHPLDDVQREVATHEDAHPFAIVALEECHHSPYDLLTQQDHTDQGQQAYGTTP